MGQMPENSSWPESMKSWGPKSSQESGGYTLQYDPYEDETQNEQIFPC